LLCGCAGQPIVAADLTAATAEAAAVQAVDSADHQAASPVRVEQAVTGEKVVTVPLEKGPALSAKDEALVAKARALVCADCEKQPANAPDFSALALRASPRMTMRQEAIGPVANVGARMSPEEVMGRLKALSAEARQESAPLASAKMAMREMTRRIDAELDDVVEAADSIPHEEVMKRLSELSSRSKPAEKAFPAPVAQQQKLALATSQSVAAPSGSKPNVPAVDRAHAPALPGMAVPLLSGRATGTPK
jgi:hypothetical protein